MVMSHSLRSRTKIKIGSFYTTGTQEKIKCFSADAFCLDWNTVFEALGCFHHNCSCQEAQPLLTEDIERGNKLKLMDGMRKLYIKEKLLDFVDMLECEWCLLYKTDASMKQHLREFFPFKRALREENSMVKYILGSLLGYTHFDIPVPEHLREQFGNFPPLFKKNNVCRQDTVPVM